MRKGHIALGRGNKQCQGLEAGTSLVCLKARKKMSLMDKGEGSGRSSGGSESDHVLGEAKNLIFLYKGYMYIEYITDGMSVAQCHGAGEGTKKKKI